MRGCAFVSLSKLDHDSTNFREEKMMRYLDDKFCAASECARVWMSMCVCTALLQHCFLKSKYFLAVTNQKAKRCERALLQRSTLETVLLRISRNAA